MQYIRQRFVAFTAGQKSVWNSKIPQQKHHILSIVWLRHVSTSLSEGYPPSLNSGVTMTLISASLVNLLEQIFVVFSVPIWLLLCKLLDFKIPWKSFCSVIFYSPKSSILAAWKSACGLLKYDNSAILRYETCFSMN